MNLFTFLVGSQIITNFSIHVMHFMDDPIGKENNTRRRQGRRNVIENFARLKKRCFYSLTSMYGLRGAFS